MKYNLIKFKTYCNDKNLQLYKTLKLYNVINKRIKHTGLIDYDDYNLKFIGNNKLIGYYYGNVSTFKINLLTQEKFNTIYFMIFLRMDEGLNDVFKVMKDLNISNNNDLVLSVDNVKRLKKKKILLLCFK